MLGALSLGTATAASVFALLVLAVAVADLRARRIPNPLTLGLFVTGWAAALLGLTPGGWLSAAIASALALVVFGVIYLALGARRVGLGDVKLGLAVAPWLGVDGLVLVMFGASLLLLLAALVIRRRETLPFAPFVALVALPLYALALRGLGGGAA
ncbi:MAG: prepilin peptidase [Azospirillaceae bacterium]